MAIALDHIFACCEPGGPEAEALLGIGLVEGSGNVHPGQGTANRRFFFQGGFIELLWVSDAEEAQSPMAAPTRLWQRWSGRKTAGCCPFGIAFSSTDDPAPSPPFAAWAYRPNYLPPAKAIHFAQGTAIGEPELFYLGWSDPQRSAAAQPKDHRNGLVALLSASVGLPPETQLSTASLAVEAAGLLSFHAAPRYEMHLCFSARDSVRFNLSPKLPMVLTARSLSAPMPE